MSELSDLLPPIGQDGVYRYPDGSSVIYLTGITAWVAIRTDGWGIPVGTGPLARYESPQAAARALLAIGQGPASLKPSVPAFDAEAFVREVLRKGQEIPQVELVYDQRIADIACEFAAKLQPHLR